MRMNLLTKLNGSIIPEIRRSLTDMPLKNAASFRLVRREWSVRLKNIPGTSVISLAKKLVPIGTWERIFAYEIIVNHNDALSALTEKTVTLLGRGINSWGEVDLLCLLRFRPGVAQGNISDKLIQTWAQSPDRWWKRAALVSTVPLNNRARGGKGDAVRTLKICRMLLSDRDDMIVKALSWALRELSKREPLPVSLFLEQHDKQLAPRVKREVTNKLKTGLKNPRRV